MKDKITPEELQEIFGETMPLRAVTLLTATVVPSMDELRLKLKKIAEEEATTYSVKQMIIMRNDLGMRKGKIAAQAAHACIGALTKNAIEESTMFKWQDTGSAKICARVDSYDELMAILKSAQKSALPVYLVTDAGRTEFKEPTVTCCAIGPAEAWRIDPITGHLKLL